MTKQELTRWTPNFHSMYMQESASGAYVEHEALTAAQARIEALERANRTQPDYDIHCTQCGKAHILDTSIESSIWNQIAGQSDLLCTLCIDERLAAAGLKAECRFYYVGPALNSELYEDEKRNARIELLEAEAVAGRAAIEKLERMVVWMANSGISFTEIPGEVAWFSEEADTMIYIPCDGTAPSILAAVEKAMDKP